MKYEVSTVCAGGVMFRHEEVGFKVEKCPVCDCMEKMERMNDLRYLEHRLARPRE